MCEVDGCGARPHGRGLCRIHYDEARYLDTTGQSPEAQARARREQAIEMELWLGSTSSMFTSEDEHRRAWEERRDEMLSEYLTPPALPGRRPAAWWRFEAGRPAHLTSYPLFRHGGTTEERADLVDAYYIEPLVFMAEHGHLTDEEIAALADAADEARPRIGTTSEHIGSGGVDRVDRRCVLIWEAVEAALKQEATD